MANYTLKHTGEEIDSLLDKAGTALQEHQDISGKQDVISDLEEIRSGASKGMTALQEVPEDVATKTDVANAITEAITTTLNTEV